MIALRISLLQAVHSLPFVVVKSVRGADLKLAVVSVFRAIHLQLVSLCATHSRDLAF